MVEELHTYLNMNNLPIIRRCRNCVNWKEIETTKTGYCALQRMYFSSTLTQTVFGMTKEFYLCEDHEFKNEKWLEYNSQRVNLRDSLKSKEQI